MGGQRVVDGDGDAAGGQGPALDQLADVSLEGEMAPLVLYHVEHIHPLQIQGDKREAWPFPAHPHTQVQDEGSGQSVAG